tara:strand:+ start:11884 stop:12264 length:381 start_codon:yes stop_codon:yes gene_type:complete
MAIELIRKRVLTATEDKANGARLLAVDNEVRSKSMQECYNSLVQVNSQQSLLLPTAATNLGVIRYVYIETTQTLGISIDAVVFNIEPIVANGLAIFEADIKASAISLINLNATTARVHVFIAGDTL